MSVLSPSLRPMRFCTHSRRVLDIACAHGWLPGARYTNLRDVRAFDQLGFLDIDWKNYDFDYHLRAARSTHPLMTVARDILRPKQLSHVLVEASELAEYCQHVIIVPKHPHLRPLLDELIPPRFILGYSVPTEYGKTPIPPDAFRRPVHLLGGRPDQQRALAKRMPIFSFDCNRFTLDAAYGDYFDRETFRPHPIGGYYTCVEDSIRNINRIWSDYIPDRRPDHE